MRLVQALIIETLLIGFGTYLIRAGSLILGSRAVWPAWAREWLSFVTPAVLGALILPLLLLKEDHFVPVQTNAALWAAVPAVLAAWLTRNIFWTVLIGVGCFALTSRVLG